MPARRRFSAAALRRLFGSPAAQKLKVQLCEIGRRGWQRGFHEGNGGNFSTRLGDFFLCTPTGVSKGFLRPEMIVLVDDEGRQVAGRGAWRATSEILSHLGIYRAEPRAQSVVHAHPVHATAFAVAGILPPPGLLPEIELFAGPVPLTEYKAPGSPAMAATLGRLAPQHQAILMGNHGLICWGSSVEDAYFKLEIVDAYCRTVALAAALPGPHPRIPPEELRALLELKKRMRLPDERHGWTVAQLTDADPWRQWASGRRRPSR